MGEQIWVPIFSIAAVLLLILGGWIFSKFFSYYMSVKSTDNKQKEYLKPCDRCLDYFFGPSYDLCVKCRGYKPWNS